MVLLWWDTGEELVSHTFESELKTNLQTVFNQKCLSLLQRETLL